MQAHTRARLLNTATNANTNNTTATTTTPSTGMRVLGCRKPGRSGGFSANLLSEADVGVDCWDTIRNMGDYASRLKLDKRAIPRVTVSKDGSRPISVEDDIFPRHFFNRVSGQFIDSAENRAAALVSVDFGNPHRNSPGFVGEMWKEQRPTSSRRDEKTGTTRMPEIDGGGEGEDEAQVLGKRARGAEGEDANPPSVEEPDTAVGRPRATETRPVRERGATPQEHARKKSSHAAAPQQQPYLTNVTEAHLTNSTVKPHIKLPQGWIVAWSKTNSRWYFNNVSSKRSVWELDKVSIK